MQTVRAPHPARAAASADSAGGVSGTGRTAVAAAVRPDLGGAAARPGPGGGQC
jgi:hypothetical protein